MERYLRLAVSFAKRQYWMHFLLAAVFCLMSGSIMSFQNLDMLQAANVMERYAVINGILLLTPLFMPEQDRDIWLLEKSKAIPMWHSYILRIAFAFLVILLVIAGFLAALYLGDSTFSAGTLFLGTLVEMLFLGGIGFFASAVTNQVVIGYMVAFVYYLANMGGVKYFGKLGLLQMVRGQEDFWYWQLLAAAVLVAGGVFIRERRNVYH